MWTRLFFIICAIFIGWLIYRGIRHDKAAFSKGNLGKSFFMLGILALFLIAFVALLVVLSR